MKTDPIAGPVLAVDTVTWLANRSSRARDVHLRPAGYGGQPPPTKRERRLEAPSGFEPGVEVAKLTGAMKRAALNEEDVMAMLVMAFPIPAGKTEQWKKFISELTGARKAEFAASRRSLGVRERTFLQHTPQGDLVIVTLEGDHPETAFAEFGKRTDPFRSRTTVASGRRAPARLAGASRALIPPSGGPRPYPTSRGIAQCHEMSIAAESSLETVSRTSHVD
jgi:hypothetical protein